MAENPLRNTDRILQTKSEKGDVKQSVTLFDIDYAIMTYLEDVILPNLEDNGKELKIPVIYGNSERWNASRKEGIYRDIHGKIQLPILMLRRTSVAKNESIPMLNRHVSYQSIKKYSKQNKYDRFSLLGSKSAPKYELFNITMPDYVEVSYECMAWTNYVEQLNTIVEALTFASEEYWGDKKRWKFNTTVADYNIVNEVTDGNERINRIECNFTVKAYLLPEKFDNEATTKKIISTRKIVFATEVDATANGRLENLLANPSPYYDNKILIDFLSLNNSITQNPISTNTITFGGLKLIATPPELSSVVNGTLFIAGIYYDIKVFINGVRYYQNTHFNTTYVISTGNLKIDFDPVGLGFNVDTGDEIVITGKFLQP